MKTLQEIQIEQRAWSRKNFGEHPSWHPLAGVMEELGELAHAFLKREQGIRGTREEHDAAIRDAVGDIMIYLVDYCSCQTLLLRHGLSAGDASAYLSLIRLEIKLGRLATAHLEVSRFRQEAEAADFVAVLDEFCQYEGLDLLTVVNETWDRVSKRDWTKNKVDGGEAPLNVGGFMGEGL